MSIFKCGDNSRKNRKELGIPVIPCEGCEFDEVCHKSLFPAQTHCKKLYKWVLEVWPIVAERLKR